MSVQHYEAEHFQAQHFTALYGTGAAGGLLANDITSASSVTSPALHQVQALDAVNVTSASSVTSPTLVAAAFQVALFANDIVSASSVTQARLNPPISVAPPEVIRIGGAGGGVYHKAWEKEFDRRRAREEGIPLYDYIHREEIAARRAQDARDAAAAAITAAALTAAAEARALAAKAAAIEQATQDMMQQALLQAEMVRQAELAAAIEQRRKDDALAVLLLSM